jgi:hypothetical protein
MAKFTEPESKDFYDWIPEKSNRNTRDIIKLQNEKLSKVWVTPTLINSWAHQGAPYHKHQYREFARDMLHVRGALTGGTSGTIAYYLLEPFWPDADVPVHGWVYSGASITPAVLILGSTNGSVTVVF